MHEYDLTEPYIISLLEAFSVKKGCRKDSEYIYAKGKLSDEWNDNVARIVAEYVGI